MRRAANTLRDCLVAYLVLIVGGTLLLVLSYCLPVEPMCANIEDSSLQLTEEGDYYVSSLDNNDWRFMYDNFTTAIMLNLAGHATGNPLRDAMLQPLHVTKLEDKGRVFQLAEWLDEAYDEPYDQLASYPIYWHGYLVVLKPLLYLFDLYQIRRLALVAIVGLATLLGARLARFGGLFSLVFIVPMICFNITEACQSPSFVGSFFVGLLAGLVLTKRRFGEKTPSVPYVVFLCSGALTAYVDFLNTPIVSLGIPLLVWLCADGGSITNARKTILTAIGFGLAWSAGYVLFWTAKWSLATLITGQDVLRSAFDEILNFAGSDGGDISRIDAVKRNLALAFPAWSRTPMLLGCVVVGIIAILRRNRLQPGDCWFVLACVVVAIIPVAWIGFTSGHSYIHYWFTYRNLVLAPMAMLAAWSRVLALPPQADRPKTRLTGTPPHGQHDRTSVGNGSQKPEPRESVSPALPFE